MLLTDLPSVVEGSLLMSIDMNCTDKDTMGKDQSKSSCYCEDPNVNTGDDFHRNKTWHQLARRVGKGSCFATALDWEKSLEISSVEAGIDLCYDIDIVLSSESVWLKELIHPFVSTFLTLLQSRHDTVGYMCARDRSSISSKHFANPSDVVAALVSYGCSVDLLFQEASNEDDGKDVNFYRIKYRKQ